MATKTGSCSSQGLDMLIRFALIKMENQSAKQQYQQIRIVELHETIQQIDKQLNAIDALLNIPALQQTREREACRKRKREFKSIDLELVKRKLKDKYIVGK